MRLALLSDDNEFRVIMLHVAQEWLDLARLAEKAAAAKREIPRRSHGLRR
jgi:hypothetical protein